MDEQRSKNAFSHPEAFCLMRYHSETADRLLLVWNSRDGVTPFCFYLDGHEYQHVEWNRDRRIVDHKLSAGDLIWRDIKPEEASSLAMEAASRRWGKNTYGCRERFASAAELASVIEESFGSHESPAPMLARIANEDDREGTVVL